MPNDSLPTWDEVLSAAARLQKIVPHAVLAELESVAGWRTARVNRPVLILGSLDGIETGIRQLLRDAPLETQEVETAGVRLRLPTPAEILRIKAVLILRRNATRDYVDLAALVDHVGFPAAMAGLREFDALYPQPGEASALQQLAIQLATPQPFDLEGTSLAEYKNLAPRWHDWRAICTVLEELSARILDELLDPRAEA